MPKTGRPTRRPSRNTLRADLVAARTALHHNQRQLEHTQAAANRLVGAMIGLEKRATEAEGREAKLHAESDRQLDALRLAQLRAADAEYRERKATEDAASANANARQHADHAQRLQSRLDERERAIVALGLVIGELRLKVRTVEVTS